MRPPGAAPILLIMCTLVPGTGRCGAVRAAVCAVSPKTIAQRLKTLEEVGFVQREACVEISLRVAHHLARRWLALIDAMTAFTQFGERYHCEHVSALPDPPRALATGQ